MKHFCNIFCDTDLGLGYCDIKPILCACDGCDEQLSHKWLQNVEKHEQPCYAA